MPRTTRRSLMASAVLTALVPATIGLTALGLGGTAVAAENTTPIGPGYSTDPAAVECVQRALAVDASSAPGTYGPATTAAVIAFQNDQGITPATGIVGLRTGDALTHAGRVPDGCASRVPTSATSTGSAATALTSVGVPAGPPPGASPSCDEGSRPSAKAVAAAGGVTEPTQNTTHDTYDRATIKLRYSAQAHCAWAWIGGQPGARVWIDREHTGANPSASEPHLGERDIQEGNPNSYGAAYKVATDGNSWVRACGQVREAPTCTLWFNGTTTATDDTLPSTPSTTSSSSGSSEPARGTGDGPTTPDATTSTSDAATGTSAQLAQQVLDSPHVVLDGRLVRSDLEQTAAGKPASAGVPVSAAVLRLVMRLAQDHSVRVTALESGGTGHAKNSRHFTGDAVDFGSIDGHALSGRDSNSLTAINAMKSLLPPDSGIGQSTCQPAQQEQALVKALPAGVTTFKDSCNHLHVQVPRDSA